ncbi:hypothetical protein TSPI_01102, partial [Trichinella spiralis]
NYAAFLKFHVENWTTLRCSKLKAQSLTPVIFSDPVYFVGFNSAISLFIMTVAI